MIVPTSTVSFLIRELLYYLVERSVIILFAMASETESNTVLKLQADYFDLFDLRIAKVLGTGKSAEVVLAVSNSFEGINRAVKRFSLKKKDLEKRNISLERAKKLFYHEVKIVRDLEHPNIIGGSNGIECPGYLAIAMDYCPRGNLADHLKRMNSGLIDRFFTGVVAGVDYIHSLRIVHGDIKLQNIFIDEKHRPVLGDFGVSYQMPENKQYVKTAGATMGYFAPEVLKKVDSVDPFKVSCSHYWIIYTQSVCFNIQ